MSTIDTPDYQRGIINAQKLLGSVANGANTLTVGVPPNAETLVIYSPSFNGQESLYVSGVQSSVAYPVVKQRSDPFSSQSYAYVADVSSAIDTQITVQMAGIPPQNWHVVADSGIRLTSPDPLAQTLTGVQYVIPTAPSQTVGDHPAVELQHSSFAVTVSGQVLGFPPTGQRYRLFAASMSSSAGSAGVNLAAYLYASLGGEGLAYLAYGGGGLPAGCSVTTYPLTGIALPTDSAINLNYDAGSGIFIRGSVTYTTEKP